MPTNGVVGTTPNSCNSLTALPMNAIDIYAPIPMVKAKSTLRGNLLPSQLIKIATPMITASPTTIPAITYNSMYFAKDSMAW